MARRSYRIVIFSQILKICFHLLIMSSRSSALQLYRNLLRYSKNLQFTDKEYFVKRIREAFEKNRTLDDPQSISQCIKVKINQTLSFLLKISGAIVALIPVC